MLNKIKFAGFTITASSFKLHKPSGEGKFEIKFDQAIIKNSESIDDLKSKSIAIQLKPKLIGYAALVDNPEHYEDDPSFEVEMELKINFDNLNDDDISEEQFKENSWFFENFLSIAVKLGFESILKNTMLEDVPLAWSLPDIKMVGEEDIE